MVSYSKLATTSCSNPTIMSHNIAPPSTELGTPLTPKSNRLHSNIVKKQVPFDPISRVENCFIVKCKPANLPTCFNKLNKSLTRRTVYFMMKSR